MRGEIVLSGGFVDAGVLEKHVGDDGDVVGVGVVVVEVGVGFFP